MVVTSAQAARRCASSMSASLAARLTPTNTVGGGSCSPPRDVMRLSTRTLILAGSATVVLAGMSTIGWAAATGVFRDAATAPNGQCSAPALSGTVVDVSLADGGAMMGGGGMMAGHYAVGGMMRVLASTSQVPAGSVSF